MEKVSALLSICAGNSPVPGEFPAQRPVTWGFDVFFDLRPDKRLSKQSWGWLFETPSHSLWRHRNEHEIPAMHGKQRPFSTVFISNHTHHFMWHVVSLRCSDFNSSPPGQNGRLFADDLFIRIFVNGQFRILVTIPLKFVPKGLIDNKPAQVQIMAWHRIGDKQLSESMLTWFTYAYMRH